MPKKIKLYRIGASEFRFDVIAENRAILGSSEEFSSKVEAINAIKFMQENIEDESRYEIFTGSNDKFFFRLVCEEKDLVLCSQGYTSDDSIAEGIKSFKETAVIAKIVDRKN